MNLFDTTQSALELAMSGASARHVVLAGNIANANTPGYQRRDVDFHTVLQKRLDGESPDAAAGTFEPSAEIGVMRVDGSGVDIDAESAKLAQNALDHQALTQVARVRIDILGYAMGVR